ncbi:dynein-related subfamily AAA family protein [Winogradskyella pacifica]|uniref:Dynein-related subfamily AAA family protein n=1 Tax=Winogradskyella pacifica TaxID=664642 RepID=A0A3D9N2G1_9FLAO|nr:AAA family ATPase [Winogradskyella pacifica]REE25022.1 dynein-related subfamily AAA family protein [Winogradskyella pacifica]
MINYRDYEKQVYDWLMQKHDTDSTFTFSVRQNASKGLELDYFIGTEKSNYFATTFWTLPVSYPGSSSDSINLKFGSKGDSYTYKFEFTQTNKPQDNQNQSVLNIVQASEKPIQEILGLKREGSTNKKMFSYVTNQPSESYKDLTTMLLDIEKDLELIIPIVNKAIVEEKKNNLEVTAHLITLEEFNAMQDKLSRRFEKHKSHSLNSAEESPKYWLYAPGRNAEHWDAFYEEGIVAIGWDKLGDLSQYESKEDVFDALKENYGGEGDKRNDVAANYEICNDMQIGDIVIVKRGRGELLGYGVITSEYFFDTSRAGYKSCRTVDWKLKGNWQTTFSLVLKTLTDVTQYDSKSAEYEFYYENLMGIMMNIDNKDLFELYNDYLIKTRGNEIKESTIEGYVETASVKITERWNELYNDKFDPRLLNYSNLIKIDPLMEKGFSGYSSFASFIYDFIDELEVYVEPTNQILFGPPGTGKTFYLKDELFDKYTIEETSISHDKFFEESVSDLTWWHVIALALLEIGTARVNAILENRWVAKKASLSESKNVRATLWGTLQMHTIVESKNVAYTQRQAPFIFDKNEDKSWSLLESELKEQVPELYDLLDKVNNFEASPDKVIKNYSFVTFHQSFAYEDFIEGIKPVLPENEAEDAKDLGYTIEDGVFKLLCTKAKNDPDNRYAIFIDEINRGNVSAIFGELITLIEVDKRTGAKNELRIKLPYSKKEFSVPSNLDIYGTMNTADRSVEALDTALRRRFEFKEMMPDYDVIANEEVEGVFLSGVLKRINERIELLIDRDHEIGHSYFVGVETVEQLAKAFNNKIVPLLQEYFYGDYGKIGLVLGKGFVEEKDNKTIRFSDFKYENSEDFKTPTYILKRVNSLSIVDAVNVLLNEKETREA